MGNHLFLEGDAMKGYILEIRDEPLKLKKKLKGYKEVFRIESNVIEYVEDSAHEAKIKTIGLEDIDHIELDYRKTAGLSKRILFQVKFIVELKDHKKLDFIFDKAWPLLVEFEKVCVQHKIRYSDPYDLIDCVKQSKRQYKIKKWIKEKHPIG